MNTDGTFLRQFTSEETGLEFEVETRSIGRGQVEFILKPAGLPMESSFLIRVSPDWRRLRVLFEPGKFAAELLEAMSNADLTGRTAFRSILHHCVREGAEVTMKIDGVPMAFDAPEVWKRKWSRFSLYLSRGQLDIGAEDGQTGSESITRWTGRFTSAIVAILPVEAQSDEMKGFPEGAVTTVKANRYERDRRNRAAAIAIHGAKCVACGLNMADNYGEVASGFIEVHHVVPVSAIGPDYQIDPERDLVPLCPNCHAIIHRQDPPFAVEYLAEMIRSRK